MNILGRPMYHWTMDSLVKNGYMFNEEHTSRRPSLLVVTNSDERSIDVHRDIRRRYGDCFEKVHRFSLPFETRGPTDTAYLALKCDAPEPYTDRSQPVWILDNDVVHDHATDFTMDEENVVKLVVVDTRDYSCPTSVIDHASAAKSESPYCQVSINPSTGLVTQLYEKEARRDDAPFVVMGAYGFGSCRLFLALCDEYNKRHSSDEENSSNALSCLVRLAIKEAHRGVRVVPVIVKNAFTVGTPRQVSCAIATGVLSLADSPQLNWVFDLDETLVTLPETPGDYSTCRTYPSTANLVRNLFQAGHRIVIYTARGMLTFDGDVERIETALKKVTEENLHALDIPYHVLKFGKPMADHYVDDKSMNPRAWRRSVASRLTADMGFGWEEYVEPTSRMVCGNVRLDTLTKTCKKTAEYPGQMKGYANYLKNVPPALVDVVPRLVSVGREGGDEKMEMEWIEGVSVAVVHVWGLLTLDMMDEVIRVMRTFHACKHHHSTASRLPSRELSATNYMPKISDRLRVHGKDLYVNVLGFDSDFIDSMTRRLTVFFDGYEPQVRKYIHGDFWLGNLIWNPDGGERRIRTIDMRGLLGNTLSTGGDCVYDFAKLYQSLAGFDVLIHRPDSVSEDVSLVKTMLAKNVSVIKRLGEALRKETNGVISMYHVHTIAFALVFGCIAFHREQVLERPTHWRRFLMDMYDHIDVLKLDRQCELKASASCVDSLAGESRVKATDTREGDQKRQSFYETPSRRRTALVIVRGIAVHNQYIHKSGKRVNVDFRFSAESITKNVIHDLKDRLGYYRVEVHLVTYGNLSDQDSEDLRSIYQPEGIHIVESDPEKSCQRDVFKRALSIVLDVEAEDSSDVDLVVILRFDTVIKQPISELSIHPDHINFLWKEDPVLGRGSHPSSFETKVSDVVHIFHPRFCLDMYDAITQLNSTNNLHGMYQPLVNRLSQKQSDAMFAQEGCHQPKLPISFVLDDKGYESNTDLAPNPVYHIVRDVTSEMLAGHTAHFWRRMLGKSWRRI
jgi:hypothetical protein